MTNKNREVLTFLDYFILAINSTRPTINGAISVADLDMC